MIGWDIKMISFGHLFEDGLNDLRICGELEDVEPNHALQTLDAYTFLVR